MTSLLALALLAFADEPPPLFPGDGRAPVVIEQAPAGSGGLTARACNSCHSEVYDEWKRSMHSAGYSDPQFQEVWRAQKPTTLGSCLNCHAPIASQHAWSDDGKPTVGFSPTLQAEGVTCAACHVRAGTIVSTVAGKAPHGVTATPSLGRSEACAGCHQLDLPGRPKGFYDTFREWSASDWARRGVTCQECHMPLRTGNVADSAHRPYRSHDVRGSHSDVLLQRALTVDVSLDKRTYEAGDEVAARIVVRNAGAGHHVPSGDPLHGVRLVAGIADSRGEFLDKVEVVFARKMSRTPPYEESADTRLAAGEVRTLDFKSRFPGGAGEHYLVVQMFYDLVPPELAAELSIPREVTSRVFDSQVVPITAPPPESGP